MKVLKFGGSTLGKGESLGRVRRIVESTPSPCVVVASAMGGVTDSLLQALERILHEEKEVEPFLESLKVRHTRALSEAEVSHETAKEAISSLEDLLERLRRLLYGIAFTQELTPRTRDFALSFGERLSVRVLSAVLRAGGVRSVPLDADEAGVITDGCFGNASPLLRETSENLKKSVGELAGQGLVPILTGFFGRDLRGNVTTFGRGGSDYSAAIVAAALDAEVLEVWKDVEGFLTADPRLIPEARPIDRMTYDEAAELSSVGAKVLHPRTVEPVKEKGIPIRVRSIEDPQSPGTLITLPFPESPPRLRAIASRGGLAILRLSGPGMGQTPGIGKKVFTALSEQGINVLNMAASQASFALLISENDLEKGLEALLEVKETSIRSIEGIRDMTLLCVVGQGIGSTHGTAGKVFTAIGKAGVNIEMISVGASEIALAFVVRGKDAHRALRAVHDAFLKTPQPLREVGSS